MEYLWFGESMTRRILWCRWPQFKKEETTNIRICSRMYYSYKINYWKIVVNGRIKPRTVYIRSLFSFLFWAIKEEKIFREFTKFKENFEWGFDSLYLWRFRYYIKIQDTLNRKSENNSQTILNKCHVNKK